MAVDSSDLLLYIIAVFIPPIPVVMKRGCGGQLCLNFVLWIIIWIPAVIHAFYIIATTPDVEKYEAVNVPSHYQNHPPAGGYGQQHQQSFHGNGPPQHFGNNPPPPPPPPPQHAPHRAEEWDTPMQGGGGQQQHTSPYAPHPQQQQMHGYGQQGGTPAPPNYTKS